MEVLIVSLARDYEVGAEAPGDHDRDEFITVKRLIEQLAFGMSCELEDPDRSGLASFQSAEGNRMLGC